jgi:hypothetical protein
LVQATSEHTPRIASRITERVILGARVTPIPRDALAGYTFSMSPFDRSQLHDEIRKEIERAGPFATIDEINRRLAALNESYNDRPQADLGGLSPRRMAELLYGDWEGAGAHAAGVRNGS